MQVIWNRNIDRSGVILSLERQREHSSSVELSYFSSSSSLLRAKYENEPGGRCVLPNPKVPMVRLLPQRPPVAFCVLGINQKALVSDRSLLGSGTFLTSYGR